MQINHFKTHSLLSALAIASNLLRVGFPLPCSNIDTSRWLNFTPVVFSTISANSIWVISKTLRACLISLPISIGSKL